VKLYQRKNGIWYLDYTLNGKRIRKSLKTNLKEVAKAKEAEIRLEIDRQNLKLDPEVISIREYFADYKRSAKQRLSPNSYKRYYSVFDNFVKFSKQKGLRLLSEVKTKHVEEYILSRKEKDKVAPKTANVELTALSGAFEHGIHLNYLRYNPAKGIKRFPKRARRKPKFFSKEELKSILESERRPIYRAIWEFLANTGLRKGELEHLEWDDIDFENREIRIRPKADWETKTKDSRNVPMNSRAFEILKELRNSTKREKSVFVNSVGNPFKPDDLYSKLKPLLKDLGIDGNVHTFRHTFASHLVMSRVDLATVGQLLGHKDISTTMIYAHLAPEHVKKAVDKLDF